MLDVTNYISSVLVFPLEPQDGIRWISVDEHSPALRSDELNAREIAGLIDVQTRNAIIDDFSACDTYNLDPYRKLGNLFKVRSRSASFVFHFRIDHSVLACRFLWILKVCVWLLA